MATQGLNGYPWIRRRQYVARPVALLIALLTLVLPAGAGAAPATAGIATEALSVNFGDFTSKAEVTYPAAAQHSSPAIILIHGGCPCDLDETFIRPDGGVQSHIFKDIAEYLGARGIAVMRYNKHYVTSATAVDYDKFGTLTHQQLLADAEQVLAAAKRDPHIDPSRIFIYGWSEGTRIAAALVRNHPDSAGLILQGVDATPIQESMRYQALEVALPYALSFSHDGRITVDVLTQIQGASEHLFVKGLVSGFFADPNPPKAGAVAVNPLLDTNKDGVLDPETEIKPGLSKVIDSFIAPGGPLAYYAPGRALPDLAEQAPQFKLPVLIVQGDRDSNVPVRDAMHVDALLPAGSDHTLKIYRGLGHSLGPAMSLSDDDFRPIATQPMADMAAWLLAHATAVPLPNTGIAGSPMLFPQTGYSLDGTLLNFWSTNGGLPIFGYPIDSARLVNERPSQWLERARFELHPENAAPYTVLLGRLGSEALQQRGIDWRLLPRDTTVPAGCRSFATTGHTLCGDFLQYWQSHGLQLDTSPAVSEAESLALFGYPISSARMETNTNGETVLTQWFERARFEYHPDKPAPYQVLLGRLGAELQPIAGR